MEVVEIDIELVDVSACNTRKNLVAGTEDADVEDLANSIRDRGLLSPIIARRRTDGRYDLVAGQRRLAACRAIGMKSITAVIRDDMDDVAAIAVSLMENAQRAELHPLDKAQAIDRLLSQFGGDFTKVGRATGLSETTLRKYVQLLDLPADIQLKLSTDQGPARIEALAELSRTFRDPEVMKTVHGQVSGFTQNVQKEILRRSGGDAGKIPQLVSEALEGCFDLHVCRTAEDCFFIGRLPSSLREQARVTLRSAAKFVGESGRYPRSRRLYWVQKTEGEKDLLIFDPGYEGGDVHIYEHKESLPASALREQVLKRLGMDSLPEHQERDVVGIWARERGSNLDWEVR